MKLKLARILGALLSSLMGVSFAADVAPFDMKQESWDELMKFKMWGSGFIDVAGSAMIPDSSGAIGAGDSLVLHNGNHTLGGAILAGGIRAEYGPDVFVTGPVRAESYFLAGANTNEFHGTYCIGNEYSYDINEYAIKGIMDAGGTLLTGSSAKTGECSTDKVPLVPNLRIPDIVKNASFDETIEGISIHNGTFAIDVPNNVDVYDVYVDGDISFSAEAKLHIRMKSPQTLVRIFVEGSIVGSSGTQIQVVYVDGTDSILVSSNDYAGNVLFFSKKSITFPAMNGDAFVQGTFMSDSISLGANMVLAGQVLANKLYIGLDFLGEKLRYVPFDPPVLSLDPVLRVDSETKLAENSVGQVAVSLDTKAQVDVLFKYCFDVKDSSKTEKGKASIQDFSITAFPACGTDTASGVIPVGSKTPAIPIQIDVKKDALVEGDESFAMKVFDLSGAVLWGNKREGSFNIVIADSTSPSPSPSFARNGETAYDISENSPTGFIIAEIPIENDSGNTVVSLKDNNAVSGKTSAADLFNVSVKNSSVRLFTKNGSLLDYETLPRTSFKVTLSLTDKEGTLLDTIIRTINVLDVNEVPSVAESMFVVSENSAKGTVVGQMEVSDSDTKNVSKFGHLEYSIVNAGGTIPFVLDSNKIVVNDPSALDYEKNKSFEFLVKVANCLKNASSGKYVDACLYDSAKVIVTLKNVNEPPGIICKSDDDKCGGPFEIEEHSPTGTVIHQFVVNDEDNNESLKVTLEDKNGKNAADIFGVKFNADTTGLEIFVKDSDNLVSANYDVRVIVKDAKGLADSVARSIKVSAAFYGAEEFVDCIDYKNAPDARCKYYRLGSVRITSLYVVPAGEDLIRANAIPNALFYVYAPAASSDSVNFSLMDDSPVENLQGVYSDDSGVVKIRVNPVYPIYNVHLGTSQDKYYKDLFVSLVYNFYVPGIEYCLDEECKEPVSSTTRIKGEVGDSLKVYARAYIPVGPRKGETDSTLSKSFFIRDADENLRFYSLNGKTLSANSYGRRIDFVDGRSAFIVRAVKAGEVGNAFTLNSFVDTESKDTSFLVSQRFPGNLLFENPAEPVKDTSIVDTSSVVPAKEDSSKTDTTVATVEADSMPVPQKVIDKLSTAAEACLVFDEETANVKRTSQDVNEVKVAYTVTVENVKVNVSYVTDSAGVVKKRSVVGDNGKKKEMQVLTVSYATKINGQNVTVSSLINAETCEMLVQDLSGNLMLMQAAEYNTNIGVYSVSYNYIDQSNKTYVVNYMVDSKGNVVSEPSLPYVAILSPADDEVVYSNIVSVVWTVDGIKQDSLTKQTLEKDTNMIVRKFCNSAGCASDTVVVIYKADDSKSAGPSFRIMMVRPFEFKIVMDESLPSIATKYAVMDLQGRVLRKGDIRSTETVISSMPAGPYLVKVGLGIHRVNIK